MAIDVKKQLNPYLSDLLLEFIKLHDLHWNVTGKIFPQVHEYTDNLYERMSDMYDEVAEKMIMLEVKPASKIEEYIKLGSIEEANASEFKDTEVITIVLKDLKHLKEEALRIHEVFDEQGVFSVTTMLEDHITAYEKDIWFLKAMLND